MRRRSKESGSERSLRVSAGHAWISPLVSVLPVRDILVVDNGRTGTFWWSTMCMNECLCWFTTRANVDRAGWCWAVRWCSHFGRGRFGARHDAVCWSTFNREGIASCSVESQNDEAVEREERTDRLTKPSLALRRNKTVPTARSMTRRICITTDCKRLLYTPAAAN